ncbi:hypothetical protein HID58_078954 [Brassica napus]|uniref:Uncharacterized protein n=1 Tax=Brassica napus TaxID=3708 RepID=A0ABQ7XEH6_BRANA|nr:hypothetical protein HID58_078954 [Brassica napus]
MAAGLADRNRQHSRLNNQSDLSFGWVLGFQSLLTSRRASQYEQEERVGFPEGGRAEEDLEVCLVGALRDCNHPFILILSKATQIETRASIPEGGMNMTEEMLSPTSFARQVNDQIALAKAFVVIAKESKNLQFAWDLSAQIRNSQLLLSTAAASRRPLTVLDSEPTIRDMAVCFSSSAASLRQRHYDHEAQGYYSVFRSADEFRDREERKYAQIAAEEVPKSLYCLGVRLTTEWFQNSELQGKLVERSHAVASKLTDNSLPLRKSSFISSLTRSTTRNEVMLQDSDTQSYYFSGQTTVDAPNQVRNPKYLSMLNHLRNVNGAVETCMETFHRASDILRVNRGTRAVVDVLDWDTPMWMLV